MGQGGSVRWQTRGAARRGARSVQLTERGAAYKHGQRHHGPVGGHAPRAEIKPVERRDGKRDGALTEGTSEKKLIPYFHSATEC